MTKATAKKPTVLALGSDVSSSSLADRLIDVSAKLEELREQRGIAYLDSKPFDASQILALETEFHTLRAAEAEATRRERDAEEASRERRRDQVRKHILDTEPKRIEAVMAAENAAIALVVALKDIETYSMEIDQSMTKLGFRFEWFTPDSVRYRFCRRFTGAMRSILSSGWRKYGDIDFPDPYDYWLREWVPAEMELTKEALDQATKPTQKDQPHD